MTKAIGDTERDSDRVSFPRLSNDLFPSHRAIHFRTGPIDLPV